MLTLKAALGLELEESVVEQETPELGLTKSGATTKQNIWLGLRLGEETAIVDRLDSN